MPNLGRESLCSEHDERCDLMRVICIQRDGEGSMGCGSKDEGKWRVGGTNGVVSLTRRENLLNPSLEGKGIS